MAMVVNHNMQAENANRVLGTTTTAQAKSTEKLSSGLRINRAADDAAGLTISEKMRSQVRGLNQASANCQDGVSLIQTAEGALNEAHSILQRMNELTVQGANDTNTSSDRAAIKEELNALSSELTRIAQTTEFNKQSLLSGKFTGKKLQVGANCNQFISISISAMNAGTLGVDKSNLSVSTYDAAQVTLSKVQKAISKVSQQRSKLGALQNRLEHTIANLDTSAENATAAESRIRDLDMAEEMVNYSKLNILAQAGQSMLAQANQSTQGVLSILG